MPPRTERLADFISDRAPSNTDAVEVLCEDHVGTYTLPYLCRWAVDGWTNAETGGAIIADVVGWRVQARRAAS